MKKNYVFDTRILLFEPDCLFLFEDNDLYISPITLNVISQRCDLETGNSARKVRRILDTLRNSHNNFAKGIPLGEGLGSLYVLQDVDFTGFLPGMTKDRPDDLILAGCVWLSASSKLDTVLVTDNTEMAYFADLLKIKSECFRNRRVSEESLNYRGRNSLLLSDEDFCTFCANGRLSPPADTNPILEVNEFLILHNAMTQATVLGRFNGRQIVRLQAVSKETEVHPYGVTAKNVGQRFMQEALLLPQSEVPLVIINGPAGTAKTFLSLACGLQKVVEEGEYERILITRANVRMDETYGYLPGSEDDKLGPMLRPFYDNLRKLTNPHNEKKRIYKDGIECPSVVQQLFEQEVIVAESMEFMRGRSISNTFIIIDEAQNCTPNQILTIVSRVGEGSKIVLMGDPKQVDNKYLNRRNNGLVFAAERFKGSPLCCQITMDDSESIRSPLAKEAIVRLSDRDFN